jgi:hypothetical protein
MQHNKHTNCLINKLLQMKQLILLTTVFFTLFSCKKYKPFEISCTLTQDSSQAKKYIKGTWEWVEEKRANDSKSGYSYKTPKTEGYILRMIIGDSTLSFYKNSEKSDYKYKIQLWGEISGNFNSTLSFKSAFVLYNLNDGNLFSAFPISICNEVLIEQLNLISDTNGDLIWRKL